MTLPPPASRSPASAPVGVGSAASHKLANGDGDGGWRLVRRLGSLASAALFQGREGARALRT